MRAKSPRFASIVGTWWRASEAATASASGRGSSKEASRKRVRRPYSSRRSRATASMSGSTSINSTMAPGAAREDGFGEGARAAPEVEDVTWFDARDLAGRDAEHRLVTGDEAPDRLVVGVDLDAEMPLDGMATHAAEYTGAGDAGRRAALQAVRAAVASGHGAEVGAVFPSGVTTCAARRSARAGRRPAFQAVRATGAPRCHAEVGAVVSGWGWDVRGPEVRACRSETGVPSRRVTFAVGRYAEGGAAFSGWGWDVRSAARRLGAPASGRHRAGARDRG